MRSEGRGRPMRQGRAWAVAVTLALALTGWLPAAAPAVAESIVINAGAAGPAGWQVEADRPSPAPPGAALAGGAVTRAAAATTYVVQPGDTLSGIAARLGVDQAALAAANDLTRPDQLQAGRRLIVAAPAAGAATLPALSAASGLAHLQLAPWPPVQGQTVTLWWRTAASAALTLTVRLGDRAIPTQARGHLGWALLPVGPLAATVTEPLALVAGGAPSASVPPEEGDRGRSPAFMLPFPIKAGVFESGDVPPDTADPILSQAAKVQAEAELMTALFARESPFGWTPAARFHLPLPAEGIHTSPFGTRRLYGSSTVESVHNGEDYAVPAGTPVLAPAPGIVVLAEPLLVRGNAVVIDHGHGVLTGYWHMQVLKVKAGDQVAAGQQLGEVGSTGLSTGPHLHWELHIHGVAVDPLQWLG